MNKIFCSFLLYCHGYCAMIVTIIIIILMWYIMKGHPTEYSIKTIITGVPRNEFGHINKELCQIIKTCLQCLKKMNSSPSAAYMPCFFYHLLISVPPNLVILSTAPDGIKPISMRGSSKPHLGLTADSSASTGPIKKLVLCREKFYLFPMFSFT